MKDIFKNITENSFCKKSGICSVNPVINALDAVILNEIRQISFYIVKLKEFGITNDEIMKETVFNLSVSVSDTNFNKNAFLTFYLNLKNTKEKIKTFYIKNFEKLNTSYEIVTTGFVENETDISDLIKARENIVKHFYNNLPDEKVRLINLILISAKTASIELYRLSKYDKDITNYCFEVLRLISITNNIGTRYDKYVRRIKEFSKIKYEIKEAYNKSLIEAYGNIKESFEIDSSIYEGKSIFITGGDLFELYNLLKETEEKQINVYTDITMLHAYLYPAFGRFKNLKGLFGLNDTDYIFSNFKGPLYITRNSDLNLDMTFRGNIYCSKTIPGDKAVKISANDLSPIINSALDYEGFQKETKEKPLKFSFSFDKIETETKNSDKKKILIAAGEIEDKIKENFKDCTIINLDFPYETNALHYITNNFDTKNISVLFSKCSINSVDNLISILDKGYEKIYFSNCLAMVINPHITDSLRKDFGIETI